MEKKIIESLELENYEILTDTGYKDIIKLHKTVKYEIYELKTQNFYLKCADNHILFKDKYEEVFVKDLKIGDKIYTSNGLEEVLFLTNTGIFEHMYDFELGIESNHRYYTNGVLSHNTELAKKLAEFLFNNKTSLIRINMNEFGEKDSVTKLIGTSPGYIGYEEGGKLTNAIKNKPYCVLLLDEIEKAHPDVFDTFLQMLDEGELTDGQGTTVDFRNVIIVMTSNIGTKHLKDFGKGIGFNKSNVIESVESEEILLKQIEKSLKPELLNRIDSIVYFNQLTKENLYEIIDIYIEDLNSRIKEHGHVLKVSDKVKDLVIEKGYDEKYGARVIERAISTLLEDSLTELILNGIKENSVINADVDKDNKVTYKVK